MNDASADADIIQTVLAGDRHAFRELVERYQRLVYKTAYSMTGDVESARDAAQEIFYRAYKGLGGFDLKLSFGAWIKRIAVNYMLDEWKKKRLFTESLHNEAGETIDFPSDEYTPMETLADKEEEALIWKAVQELPAKYREAIILRHVHELRYEEIAERLRMPIGTVTTNLHRARNLLAERLVGLRSEVNDTVQRPKNDQGVKP